MRDFQFLEAKPRELIEAIRWPNGIVCPKCGSEKGAYDLKGETTRPGLKKCSSCRKTFTVTTGTIMEDTHLALAKWIEIIPMILRETSINEIRLNLDVTAKTAHRIVLLMRMALEEGMEKNDAYQEFVDDDDAEFTWDVFESVLRRIVAMPRLQPTNTKPYSEAKKQVTLEKAKQRVARRWKEEELIGLLLYKGNISMGRAQGLLNFLLIMLDADINNIGQISRISKDSKDIAHLAGLHKGITIGGLNSFLFRLRNTPKILVAEPMLLEYADHLTGGSYPQLTPIDRWSRRTSRDWRYKKTERARRKKEVFTPEPLPEFYPFIANDPTEEHKLLMAVHNAVPKGLPVSIREDVCQDLLVAILSNEFTIEELPEKIKPFITQTWRMYPGKYGPLSLDAPPPWDDHGRSLLDTIADEVQTTR